MRTSKIEENDVSDVSETASCRPTSSWAVSTDLRYQEECLFIWI